MEGLVEGDKGDCEQLELGPHPASLWVLAKIERHGTVFGRVSSLLPLSPKRSPTPTPGSGLSGLVPATLADGLASHIAV